MRSAIAAAQLAVMLLASPAAAAASVDVIPACSPSAHVSWRPDDRVEHIDQVVVTIPGCDQGEPVTLQVLTTAGDVPEVPLVAHAQEGRAVFEVEALALTIESMLGTRVTVFGEEIAVLGEQEGRGSGDEREDRSPDGSPLPVSGFDGLALGAIALALILVGSMVLRRRRPD